LEKYLHLIVICILTILLIPVPGSALVSSKKWGQR
jgi:hypothetical protein